MSNLMNATSGSDGKLHLTIPVDRSGEEFEVEVIVRPKRLAPSREEWQNWVASMGGSWQGDFERMPQGEYEEREPLS
jgi:hypothetical protein